MPFLFVQLPAAKSAQSSVQQPDEDVEDGADEEEAEQSQEPSACKRSDSSLQESSRSSQRVSSCDRQAKKKKKDVVDILGEMVAFNRQKEHEATKKVNVLQIK